MNARLPDEAGVSSSGIVTYDESHRVAVDFLLAEYGHLAELFRWNEETGERRVNIVLTIMTAASAATGVILSQNLPSISVDSRLNAAGGVGLGLLILGLATLARIVRRNVATDEYRRALDDVRGRLKRFDPEILADYDPFPKSKGKAPKGKAPKGKAAKGKRPLKRLFGLTLFVSAINSLVLVASLLMLLRLPAVGALLVAACVLVLSIVAQLWLSRRIEKRLRKEVGFKDEELLPA